MKTLFSSLALLLLAQSGFALPISISTNNIAARVYDGDVLPNYQQDVFSGAAVPSSDALSASRGTSSSDASVLLTGSGSSFELDISMDHAIDNSAGHLVEYAQTQVSVLNFFALENATYALSGLYDVADADDLEATVTAYLYDLTLSSYLFLDSTRSRNLSGSTAFNLGDVGDGNDLNGTLGSLSGNLVSGHHYYFLLDASIYARDSGGWNNASGAASGQYSLQILTATAPVPEPGSLGLLGAALFGFGFIRRKRAA